MFSPRLFLALFLFSPTSHKHEFYNVTSGFTRLFMKTKYVCQNLISPYVNFQNNRTMWTKFFLVKFFRWGKTKKSRFFDGNVKAVSKTFVCLPLIVHLLVRRVLCKIKCFFQIKRVWILSGVFSNKRKKHRYFLFEGSLFWSKCIISVFAIQFINQTWQKFSRLK